MEPFEMKFKIYMEAEDIGQSRIHTSIAFFKKLPGKFRSEEHTSELQSQR